MKNKIFVALQQFSEYSPEPKELLEKSGYEISFNKIGRRLTEEDIIKMASDAHGIIAGVEPYDRNVLSSAENLKCISRCGVGTDNIDLEFARQKGISILNTPEAVIQPVAEMTLGMILNLLRFQTYQTLNLKSGKWKKSTGYLLKGRKIGIIGLGRIGKKIADLLKKLEADVYGFDITENSDWAKQKDIKLVSLEELLRNSDLITIHISIAKENPFLLGSKEIEMMKPGSFVVNTSRGQAIDEEAICKGLSSGKIKGVALDVFNHEPYDGPLLKFENVVLTPHVSTLTEESRTEMEKQSVLNLLLFFLSQK